LLAAQRVVQFEVVRVLLGDGLAARQDKSCT
jgi:hypothetical protein